MDRQVPYSVFEDIEVPVLVSDEAGRVEFVNPSAETLFGTDRSACLGRHCCEIARLRTASGDPFCRERCPIRRDLRAGRVPAPRSLHLHPGPPAGRAVRLVLFPLPAHAGREARAVLHVLHLLPAPAGNDPPESPALTRLTAREREVLGLLAAGLGTDDIAARLFVSPATVRNHVRSILSKLGVHHRIEAVLAWLLRGLDR